MYKQIIKDLLVPKLSRGVFSAIAEKIVGVGIPIFMLHQIYPDNTSGNKLTPAYLRSALRYLKQHKFNFVSVTDIVLSMKNNRPLPPKSVAFTIDDGFVDQATIAAPIFIEFKCPVTIFLITGFIDSQLWPWFSKVSYLLRETEIRSFVYPIGESKYSYSLNSEKDRRSAMWDIQKLLKLLPWDSVEQAINTLAEITQIKLPVEPPEGFRPISWSQARKLEETGIVSFGPHTVSHPILSRVSDEQSHEEINLSWEKLKHELQNPCPIFCYPNGTATDFGKREIEIIKKTDMLGALSTIHSQLQVQTFTDNSEVMFSLPRYSLPTNFNDLIMYSSWIELAKEKFCNRK